MRPGDPHDHVGNSWVTVTKEESGLQDQRWEESLLTHLVHCYRTAVHGDCSSVFFTPQHASNTSMRGLIHRVIWEAWTQQ